MYHIYDNLTDLCNLLYANILLEITKSCRPYLLGSLPKQISSHPIPRVLYQIQNCVWDRMDIRGLMGF